MRVVGRKRLDEFRERHGEAGDQVHAWLCEVEEAKWEERRHVKQRYPHASFLGDNRVVFKIKGNKYRIDTKVNWHTQIVLVKRVGTPEECDH